MPTTARSASFGAIVVPPIVGLSPDFRGMTESLVLGALPVVCIPILTRRAAAASAAKEAPEAP